MSSERENIQFDEKLAEIVRQYPCLYDKTKKEHKDKKITSNTWRKVAEELGVEEGEAAKRLFENLKKKYSKRRINLQKVERSGTSTDAVAYAREKLGQLNFLAWLFPFIQARGTRANLPLRVDSTFLNSPATCSEISEVNEEVAIDYDQEYYAEVTGLNEDLDQGSNVYDDDDGDDLVLQRKEQSKAIRKRPFIDKTPVRKRTSSVVTGKQKWQRNKIDIERAELEFLKKITKVVDEPRANADAVGHQDDENYHFGMMIAAGIRKLSKRSQLIARNQIQNMLFDIQIQEQQFLQYGASTSPSRESFVTNTVRNGQASYQEQSNMNYH